jgi:hypothetical protein
MFDNECEIVIDMCVLNYVLRGGQFFLILFILFYWTIDGHSIKDNIGPFKMSFFF